MKDFVQAAHRLAIARAMRGEPNVVCETCGRPIELYKRPLHAEMARFLVRLVRLWRREQRPYTAREVLGITNKASTDASFLTHWGLVTKDSQKPSSGYYSPTPAGIDFVDGKVSVPSHVHLLLKLRCGFAETRTTIQQALETRFDYAKLMSEAL